MAYDPRLDPRLRPGHMGPGGPGHGPGSGPGGANLVPMGARHPAQQKVDLWARVDRSTMPPLAFIGVGLVLLATGGALAAVGIGGFMTSALLSCTITLGGGLTFLGILKGKRQRDGSKPGAQSALGEAGQQQLGPPTDPAVLAERGRRILDALGVAGQATFEELRGVLKWTQPALLETLVHLKENGRVEEDLDLDTGVWIYRSGGPGTGHAGAPMLADRMTGG